MPSRDDSQPASNWADGSTGLPDTTTELAGADAVSKAAASAARHGVITVQVRSVSPGAKSTARWRSEAAGSASRITLVIRRSAKTPSGSCAITFGVSEYHQATTGASGASSGSVTDSACNASRPNIRSTTDSPGPYRPPIDTSASSRGTGASMLCRSTMITRIGCLAAAVATAASTSAVSFSSSTTIRVSASPEVTAPPVRRSAASACTTAVPVVSHSVVTANPLLARSSPARSKPARSWPPPPSAVPGQHRVGRLRPPLAGPVGLRLLAGPELLQRIDHPPGRLHLLVAREQRGVAEQHVQDQPLVGLRAGLGERLAVQEVHRHVPDLHHRARHLRAELQRDALVRLHPDHHLVLPELLGVGVAEWQVRRLLEHHRDLGHPAGQPLAGAQVERHAGPAPGVDAEPDRGV